MDRRVSDSMSVVDLCLRVRRRLYSIALQDSWWITYHADAPTAGDGRETSGDCNSDRKSIGEYIGGVQLRGVLEQRWGGLLYAALPRREVSATVLWNMECGDGQVRGLMTEAVNLLLALSPFANVIPQVVNRRDCQATLLRSFPAYMSGHVIRLLHKQAPPGTRSIQVITPPSAR